MAQSLPRDSPCDSLLQIRWLCMEAQKLGHIFVFLILKMTVGQLRLSLSQHFSFQDGSCTISFLGGSSNPKVTLIFVVLTSPIGTK